MKVNNELNNDENTDNVITKRHFIMFIYSPQFSPHMAIEDFLVWEPLNHAPVL